MPISNWSTTAADNDDADAISGINWAENQLANTVNDSARAMMAAIKGDWVGATLDTLPDAWTAYTPTIGSTAVVITGTASGRYKKIGRTVHLAVNVSIATGTGGSLLVYLPVVSAAASVSYNGSGAIIGSGASLGVIVGSGVSVLAASKYDGTSPIAPGSILAISITYEAAS